MTDDAPPPGDRYARPAGVDDATVAAVGKLSEAVEWVERARGHLYELHQLIGRADATFEEAAELLNGAGHGPEAALVERRLVGLNILQGRWTFQVVDEFDEGYWAEVREVERAVRDALVGGVRHVHEGEMKEDRRTHGRAGHEARPS